MRPYTRLGYSDDPSPPVCLLLRLQDKSCSDIGSNTSRYRSPWPSCKGIDSATRPIRVHLRNIKEDHLAVRVETHSNILKKDAFLAMQQALMLDLLAISKKHTSGPAWPTHGVVALDSKFATEGYNN